MAKISNLFPRLGPLVGGMPARPGIDPARPTESAGRIAPPVTPAFDPIPEQRPDMSVIERPTLDDVMLRVLTPDFLGNGRLTSGEFTVSLRKGAGLLGELGDGEAALAAEAVGEALEDKEMLEACRLLLVKG